MQVFVKDGDVVQALKVLKRRMQRDGVTNDIKRTAYYLKPSEKAA